VRVPLADQHLYRVQPDFGVALLGRRKVWRKLDLGMQFVKEHGEESAFGVCVSAYNDN
jgi:hypothetical protein